MVVAAIERWLDPDKLAFVLPAFVVACVLLVGIVRIISDAWERIRRAQIESDLKLDMLDRGLSAEDIERIVNASAANSKKRAPRQVQIFGDATVAAEEGT